MKIRDFIKQEICIDVYDDVCEELGIAFDGPQELTEEGKKHFAEVLDYEIELQNDGPYIVGIVKIDDQEDEEWESRLEKAKEFFEGIAGYCTVEEYERWFKED